MISKYFVGIIINVHPADNARISPRTQMALETKPVIITCKSKTLPLWLHNNKLYPSLHLRQDPPFYSLEFVSVKKVNQGKYICIGKNEEMDEFKAVSILNIRG